MEAAEVVKQLHGCSDVGDSASGVTDWEVARKCGLSTPQSRWKGLLLREERRVQLLDDPKKEQYCFPREIP